MFHTTRNSFITTFQIIFGNFDTAYIFEADSPWVKIIFFFGFQVLMTITVLNLLIAVMTDSYSKVALLVQYVMPCLVSLFSLQRINAYVTTEDEPSPSMNWRQLRFRLSSLQTFTHTSISSS